MEQPPNRLERSRENTLVAAFVVLGGGIGLLVLDVILFGGSLLSLGAFLTISGAAQYLLWGHAQSKEVAAERERLRRQEEAGDSTWTQAPADAIQDLARTRGIREK